MAISDFTITILVDQTPKEVFNAINNVRDWWQGDIIGETKSLHDEFTYRMKDIHFSKQKVKEMVPFEKIVWQVTDSNLSFTKDPSEWTGTEIVFEVSGGNDFTLLNFTHSGLVPEIECYGGCSGAWEQLIHKSLLSLITTGKGTNIFG